VVAAESAADVVEAVRFARAKRLRVSVQGTGHGAHVAVKGGLLISTRRLQGVLVDPDARTCSVGGGAHWGAVVAAAAEHGLAAIGGSSPTVGVVGYLLGGGLGPLARSHGFGSDYVIGFEVATGAGQLVKASAEANADLFWALRGGKVGLGVVIELRLRLVELRTLYAGALFFEESHIEAALRGWVTWTSAAHPQVTTSAAIIRFPPVDAVPEPLRGRRLLSIRFAYPGASDQGALLAAPLRAMAPVHLDALGELPASQVARIHNDPTEPVPSWARGMLLGPIDQDFATVLLRLAGAGTDSPFLAVEVRHLGEATRHDVPGGSAVGGRPAAFTLSLISTRPELFAASAPASANRLVQDIQAWLGPENNINFLGQPGAPDPITRTWPPATEERLATIRRQHDPDGIFAQRAFR
jgi:hypothetical protein